MSTLLLSQDQTTPAHWAAMNGDVEELELLKEHGASFNQVSNVSAAYTLFISH